MSGDHTRSVDQDQIRLVGDTILPAVATHLTDARDGLRTTRRYWEAPFTGLDLYQPVGEEWADLCVEFGRLLEESADRLTDTSGHLIWAADRYQQAETRGTELLDDVFDVLEERR